MNSFVSSQLLTSPKWVTIACSCLFLRLFLSFKIQWQALKKTRKDTANWNSLSFWLICSQEVHGIAGGELVRLLFQFWETLGSASSSFQLSVLLDTLLTLPGYNNNGLHSWRAAYYASSTKPTCCTWPGVQLKKNSGSLDLLLSSFHTWNSQAQGGQNC